MVRAFAHGAMFHRGARCSSVIRAFANGAMFHRGARCSSVVRAFAHGAMGCKERDVAPW